MPSNVVKTKRDEYKWEKAKDLAEDAGHDENYAYIMGIYKRMKPDYQFKNKASFAMDRGIRQHLIRLGNAQPQLRPHIRKVLAGMPKAASKPLQMVDALVAINDALPEGHRVGIIVTTVGSGHFVGFAYDDASTKKKLLSWKAQADLVKSNLLKKTEKPIPYGYIDFLPSHLYESLGNCSGAYTVSWVADTPVGSGWGVLLYEVAIEIATKLSGGAGLASGRREVTDLARRVWEKYDAVGRVQKLQLDDFNNTLTPDPSDNCEQESASNDPAAKGKGLMIVVDGEDVDAPWALSSLSRAYSKKTQDAIAALKREGLFWEL